MGCFSSNEEIAPRDIAPIKFTRKITDSGQSQLKDIMKMMGQERWDQAIPALQIYIEDHGDQQPQQIDGLGQNEQSLGYFQWFPHRHYQEGINSGMYIGTPYDALALCYLAQKDDQDIIEKGIKWYRDMVDDYPQNFALIMGLAHILNNKARFQEAMEYYEKVIELKPKWVKPLECIAYIYEYKRVLKKKSLEYADKILALQPNNRAALFVQGRNQKTAEGKIQVLKQVTELHPKYARAFNEIGIVNGGTLKKYEEAIKWYEKASEVCPEYASCYNNIGVNNELLKRYDEAIKWYFRGIQKDHEYKAPHANLIDVYKQLDYDDDKINELIKEFNVYPDYYYYYTGLAYYDKRSYPESIKYYMKAYQVADKLNKNIYKIHNSCGITYDDMRQNQKALDYYQKAIDKNPKYHSAYYNTAIIYKRQRNNQKAIEWYKKAIEVNPRYSYACNNLANIYKNDKNFEEAIKYYKKAVEHLSTYTLAYANMGVCYLILGNYRQAFNSLEMAKQCLPNDNNNLSAGNKEFLKENIAKFDKQGESWRVNGCITDQQRNKLRNMISSFESAFKNAYNNQGRIPASKDKVFRPQIKQILKLLKADNWQLNNIQKIYDQVKELFSTNEEYFHIIPLLFIQYFYNNALVHKKPVLQVEEHLMDITKKLSQKTAASMKQDEDKMKKTKNVKFVLPGKEPPKDKKVNLFKDVKYFEEYAQIYAQIIHVNEKTKDSYAKYKELVDYIKHMSYGTLFGIGMKVPKDEKYQFKVILRIFQKMFKKQITKERVKSIIAKIDQTLEEKQKKNSEKRIQMGEIVGDIMGTWTKEITQMVKTRKKQQVQTKFQVSDLLRAKIMYDSVDHLKKAVNGVGQMCHRKNYQIIEMDNRLAKKQTQDVVFKIQIKDAVCELQLAMKQDQSQYHFTHSIYEIERSPLGCIFGSYIFMSKGFEYPLADNCQDILAHLKGSSDQEDIQLVEAAKYVLNYLNPQTKK